MTLRSTLAFARKLWRGASGWLSLNRPPDEGPIPLDGTVHAALLRALEGRVVTFGGVAIAQPDHLYAHVRPDLFDALGRDLPRFAERVSAEGTQVVAARGGDRPVMCTVVRGTDRGRDVPMVAFEVRQPDLVEPSSAAEGRTRQPTPEASASMIQGAETRRSGTAFALQLDFRDARGLRTAKRFGTTVFGRQAEFGGVQADVCALPRDAEDDICVISRRALRVQPELAHAVLENLGRVDLVVRGADGDIQGVVIAGGTLRTATPIRVQWPGVAAAPGFTLRIQTYRYGGNES